MEIIEEKKCAICGNYFPLSCFDFNICKNCRNQKRSTLISQRKENDPDYRELINNTEKERHKKIRKCAKNLCNNVPTKQEFLKLVCKVCGREFGIRKTEYDYRLNHSYEPKYCSKKCSGISHSNRFREESQYAKNIKRIQKEI